MSKKKQTIISLEQEQVDWLENKISEGYSKSGLVRYAIKRLMEEPAKIETKEPGQKEVKTVADEEPKKVNIEKLLDFAIQCCEEGKLDGSGFDTKRMVEISKDMKQKLQNIDYLSPRMAFMVGEFKGEMELKAAIWLQEHKR